MRQSNFFVCQKCDAQFPKWEGRCRECGAWDSLGEQPIFAKTAPGRSTSTVVKLSSLGTSETRQRLSTQSSELDRVLGGGIMAGTLAIIGGDPGVGKSTLLLQAARKIAEANNTGTVLYVSGEESGEQVKERLDRLGNAPDNLNFLGDSSLDSIISAIQQTKPLLAIIDSLQTIQGKNGTTVGRPTELRDATESLMNLAKTSGTPLFLIGHVTKDGAVAGPKVLEHLVDAVLYLEATETNTLRVLRASKNRFGGINEVGVWQMAEQGLVEVPNPGGTFLSEHRPDEPGAVLTAVMKGSRVFLIEIQALVTKTKFGYPQRRATGYDMNRLQLLIAVLQKRLQLPLGYMDIHLNVVGGLKINDPATDLAVALAIISAHKNQVVSNKIMAVGEIGLQGELRPVTQLERRVEEAVRLGFTEIITPQQNTNKIFEMAKLFPAKNLSASSEIVFH
jgi:DNA repair protein RadA/Sms